MRRQKINWFFSTSESCSVAFPSLSGDETQNHVLMCGALASPATKGAHGTATTMLQVS